MEPVVCKLHSEYGIGVTTDHLVLVGDQKTFVRLQELKLAYDHELDWLISFIDDWHLLNNYQPFLIKAYYDAGLKDLAEAACYICETICFYSTLF